MEDEKLILGLILTQFVVLGGKIIFDWLKEGRVKSNDYLLKAEFEKHKKECCVTDIKKQFNTHVQKESSHDSTVDQKLLAIEHSMAQGQRNYESLRKDIASINQWLARLTGILEFKFGVDLNRKESSS